MSFYQLISYGQLFSGHLVLTGNRVSTGYYNSFLDPLPLLIIELFYLTLTIFNTSNTIGHIAMTRLSTAPVNQVTHPRYIKMNREITDKQKIIKCYQHVRIVVSLRAIYDIHHKQ